GRECRLRREPGRRQICLARLGARDIAFEGAADLAPDIDIPRRIADELELVDGVCKRGHRAPELRSIRTTARATRARPRGAHPYGREQSGTCLAGERRGLTPGGFGGLESLVRDIDLLLELIERRIAIDRPPVGAARRLARLGGLPPLGLLEALRIRRRGTVVIRTDRAAGERCKSGHDECRAVQTQLQEGSFGQVAHVCTCAGPSGG